MTLIWWRATKRALYLFLHAVLKVAGAFILSKTNNIIIIIMEIVEEEYGEFAIERVIEAKEVK